MEKTNDKKEKGDSRGICPFKKAGDAFVRLRKREIRKEMERK